MDTDLYSLDIDVISQIDHIDFDILGNDEIKRMSALGEGVGIEHPDLYENSEPKKGGLIDPRLGTISNENDCVTCGLNTTYCVGHFGHITLSEPVFHPGYLQFVQKILSCICPHCSKLLIFKTEDKIREILKTKSGKERMTYIRSISKNITHCLKQNYGCGHPIPKIKPEIKKTSSTINIIAEIDVSTIKDETMKEGKNKLRQILTPDIIYGILKNISDEDCRILGMDPDRSRPEDMINLIFPVPPVQVRPSAHGDFAGGSTMEDDLTHKLASIVKANSRIIKNKENKNEANIKYNADYAHLLQYHCATYIDNDSLNLLKSEQKGKQYKSVTSRIKTKEGRVRNNLMGKRLDGCARTVITSDPTIGNNELGVPIKIATNLTFPEIVTEHNIERLTKLVQNGRDIYPGANFVFPASNKQLGRRLLPIDLRYGRETTELKLGDIVERHLVDNDIVLLNRQPTLHKQSMMGHRIKVINNPDLQTFRLSVAITTPYNADFDGDEMNIFVPQSIQTQLELEEIASVERQIITPKSSKTIVGIVQDGLLGSFNLTSPDVKIDWRNAMDIMSYSTFDEFPTIQKNKEYSGSELYSLIIPPDISISKGTFKIKNGKLIEGRLSKEVLGSGKKNNLIQLIWDRYGVTETKNFVDNTQRIVNNFNLYYGFSVGIGDTIIPEMTKHEIDILFNTKYLKMEQLVTEVENNPDLYEQSIYEFKMYSELNAIRDEVSKITVNNLKPDNGLNIMMMSGSKGDPTNIGQINGCLGLQAFEGKIIPKKYNRRTLAYYHQNDDRPKSRGLIRGSFIGGLDFPDFVYKSLVGRYGLTEQAIKSVTGDTEIYILENGQSKHVMIGDWIDTHMENLKDNIEHHELLDQELLKLKSKVYIPTCNELGNVKWCQVTAVTRHDPTDLMFEIKTESGRKVKVANSKTLLVWNEEEDIFEGKITEQVQIGDLVPVTYFSSIAPNPKEYIKMPKYCEIDKFTLNRENGVIIGLFFANKHTHRIGKSDSICSFVVNWFEKNGINISENEITVNNLDSVIWKYSETLHNFLDDLTYDIPTCAYNTKNNFAIGILDGIFSGMGELEDDSIGITCGKLVNGMSMLCSMIGVFGNIENDRFVIKNRWIEKFRRIVTLTNDQMNDVMNQIEIKDKIDNVCCDVIMDRIISIEKIDRHMYSKLYDVTVEETYNFQISNGLCIRDTSESGYTQRKLIKSMEDMMIKYDGSVRTSNNALIQFVYGDSGADTTKQYEYSIKLLEMNNAELEKKYKFTKEELSIYKDFSDEENNKYFEDLKNLRNIIRDSVRKAKMKYQILITDFMIPFNLNRIMDSVINQSETEKKKMDTLTPKYILEKLEELLMNENTALMCMSLEEKKNKNSFKNKDEMVNKTLVKLALHNALSPKRILLEYKLNKKQFDDILVDIMNGYAKNIVEPGEMVGIISAQSMGEAVTQITLNAFHFSGIASMSASLQGIPRIKELLSVSKNSKKPMMIVYFTDEYKNSKDMTRKIASHIKHTTLGDIRNRINVYFDPDPKAKGSIMEQDNVKYILYQPTGESSSKQEFTGDLGTLPWLMRIEINREKMLDKEVTLLDIKAKFYDWWVRRFAEVKTMKKEEKRVINKITNLTILSNSDNDKQPVIHIRFGVKDTDKDQFDMATINDFVDYIIDTFKLKGIDSITDIVTPIPEERIVLFNAETGEVEKNNQYVIYTFGVNLIDIRYLIGIDLVKTISNDIVSVYDTFGIEIARSVLLKEIASAYENSGSEVNYQHISIIVDLMTFNGNINSIDRHGMNKSDADPLSRASFEKTVEQLLTASVYGEVDHMKGVSSRIMIGAVIKGGTGFCDIVFDSDMVEKSEYIDGLEHHKKYTELNPGTLANDIIKKPAGNMFVPL